MWMDAFVLKDGLLLTWQRNTAGPLRPFNGGSACYHTFGEASSTGGLNPFPQPFLRRGPPWFVLASRGRFRVDADIFPRPLGRPGVDLSCHFIKK